MHILVTTHKLQGERKNDFCWSFDGEPVVFGMECDGERVDGSCGCRRSMVGVFSHVGTTTFEVVEMDMRPSRYKAALLAGFVSSGWGKLYTRRELLKAVNDDYADLTRFAEAFKVSTVLEKRGDYIQPRGMGRLQ